MRIEPADAFDEIRPVGQIKIIDPARQDGANNPVRIVIHLEGTGRIDNNIRHDRRKLRFDIAIAIENDRHNGRTSFKRGAKCFGFVTRPSGNEEREPSFARK